ncbi:hypothetical protein KC347_g39 [Hortaea werneckii]|nr:hypothetical protein KC347_g39 [Hortaea werneckii]
MILPHHIVSHAIHDNFEPFPIAIANLEPKRLDFPLYVLESAVTTASLLSVDSRLLETSGERLVDRRECPSHMVRLISVSCISLRFPTVRRCSQLLLAFQRKRCPACMALLITNNSPEEGHYRRLKKLGHSQLVLCGA